jgi:hypothetical protein
MFRTLLSVTLGAALFVLAPSASWAQHKGGGAAKAGGGAKPTIVGVPKPNIAGAQAGASARPAPTAGKAVARGGGGKHARGGRGRGGGRGGMGRGGGGRGRGGQGSHAGLTGGKRGAAAAARPMSGGGGVSHLPIQGNTSAGYDPLLFPLVQPNQAVPGAEGAPADAAPVAPGLDPTQGGVPLPPPSASPSTPTASNVPSSVRRQ